MNVTTRVVKEELAKSYMHQEKTDSLPRSGLVPISFGSSGYRVQVTSCRLQVDRQVGGDRARPTCRLCNL